MGVPSEAARRALAAIIEGAQSVGFLKDINGVAYVDLQGVTGGGDPETDLPEFEDDTDIKPASSTAPTGEGKPSQRLATAGWYRETGMIFG